MFSCELYLYTKDEELKALYQKKSDELENKLSQTKYHDSGFDFYTSAEMSVPSSSLVNTCVKINLNVKCALYVVQGTERIPVGWKLAARSSLATKTPLRVANSVGIIDSGYRDNVCFVVDCNSHTPEYFIPKHSRLCQLVLPDLTYLSKIIVVDNEDELNLLGETERGLGGFGSTGTGV